MSRWAWACAPVLVLATAADAREPYTVCAEETRIVHEIAPRLVFNDFETASQTIVGVGYGFSRCLGDSQNRLHLEASYDHVEEGAFHADAATLAAGVEIHPLRRNADFLIIPMVLLGTERFPGRLDNTVYGASLVLSHAVRLSESERQVGDTTVTIADRQLLMDVRSNYTDRRSSDGTIINGNGGQATFYGAIGLDQAIGHSNWRWTARAAYQTLGSGPIDGFGQLTLSMRRLNSGYTNYPWSVQIGLNLGDHDYHALLLGFSLRFAAGQRRAP